MLGVSEKEVLDLAESGKIPAYKIGGVYLRFKPEQIDEFRKFFNVSPAYNKTNAPSQYSFKDRLGDFFYFNDFYLLAILLILLIVFIIFGGF